MNFLSGFSVSAGGAIDNDYSEFFAPAAQVEYTILGKFNNCVLPNKILHEFRLGLKYEKRYCYWLGYVK